MASLTPKSRSFQPKTADAARRNSDAKNTAPPEVVDPVWLIKAISVTLVAALVCGYLTLCLLFYQGQWQLVLHPSQTKVAPSQIAGTPFRTIRFGVDESGSPQLSGWLIPAGPSARYAAYTALYLPGGDGSLSSDVPTLAALHEMGINVFAFDYRGYGQSAAVRPDQERMTTDAASAWQYLTVSRSLSPSKIVLYGSGVGAALAAQLADLHPEASAIILERPLPEVIQIVLADPRVKSLPISLLFRENFAITPAVAKMRTPKLFLLNSEEQSPAATSIYIQRLTSNASAPKTIANLDPGDFTGPLYRDQVVRFLNENLR